MDRQHEIPEQLQPEHDGYRMVVRRKRKGRALREGGFNMMLTPPLTGLFLGVSHFVMRHSYVKCQCLVARCSMFAITKNECDGVDDKSSQQCTSIIVRK